MTTDLIDVSEVETSATLQGLCFIGKLTKFEIAVNKATGEIYQNLANADIEWTSIAGEVRNQRITAARWDIHTTGRTELPAFSKLQLGSGKQWLVSLAVRPEKDGDNQRYVNFTAIDAVEL